MHGVSSANDRSEIRQSTCSVIHVRAAYFLRANREMLSKSRKASYAGQTIPAHNQQTSAVHVVVSEPFHGRYNIRSFSNEKNKEETQYPQHCKGCKKSCSDGKTLTELRQIHRVKCGTAW
jgi:hypothetical protein